MFIRVNGKRFSHRHHAFCLLLYTKHLLTKHTAPPDKASRATGAWFTGHCTSIMSFVPHGNLVKRFITLVLLTRKQRPGDVPAEESPPPPPRGSWELWRLWLPDSRWWERLLSSQCRRARLIGSSCLIPLAGRKGEDHTWAICSQEKLSESQVHTSSTLAGCHGLNCVRLKFILGSPNLQHL